MKIMLIPDVHYCPNQFNTADAGGTPARLAEINTSMQWIADLMKKRDINFVIQLGDYWDDPKRIATRVVLDGVLAWCKLPGQRIMLRGNHDFNAETDLGEIIATTPQSEYIKEPTVLYLQEANSFLAFLPFMRQKDSFHAALDHLQKQAEAHKAAKRFLFIHQGVEGFIRIDPEAVPLEWFNLKLWTKIISGHYHSILKRDPIHYTGSLITTSFEPKGITQEKGVSILDTETGTISIIRNPHAKRFLTMTLKEIESGLLPEGLDPAGAYLKIKFQDRKDLETMNWEFVKKFQNYAMQQVESEEEAGAEREETAPIEIAAPAQVNIVDLAIKNLAQDKREKVEFVTQFREVGYSRILRL